MLLEATFALLNWRRGYHAPIPAQLGIAAACVLVLILLRRGHLELAARTLFASVLAGAVAVAVTTGDPDRLSPWWPVFILAAVLVFERRRDVLLGSGATLAAALGVVASAETMPYENFPLSVGVAVLIAGGMASQDVARRRQLSDELEGSLREIRTLEGLLPVCAACHHVRDEVGAWQRIDSYLASRTGVRVSHGLCPACAKEHYGMTDEELAEAVAEERAARAPEA